MTGLQMQLIALRIQLFAYMRKWLFGNLRKIKIKMTLFVESHAKYFSFTNLAKHCLMPSSLFVALPEHLFQLIVCRRDFLFYKEK